MRFYLLCMNICDTELMTREEFNKLFSKEMRARGYAISACYVSAIVFHHRTKFRNDKFVLRYEGKRDHMAKEWIPTEDHRGNFCFEFQVQDHETYNLDWDYDAHFTPMRYYIGVTDMKQFVEGVIVAVGEYY